MSRFSSDRAQPDMYIWADPEISPMEVDSIQCIFKEFNWNFELTYSILCVPDITSNGTVVFYFKNETENYVVYW